MYIPSELAKIITDYAEPKELRDWIPRENIDESAIWANPSAYDAGRLDFDAGVLDGKKLPYIARNPVAAQFIRANIDTFITLPEIWANPAIFALVLCEASRRGIPSCHIMLALNTSEHALDHLYSVMRNNLWSVQSFIARNPSAEDKLLDRQWVYMNGTSHANPSQKILEYTKREAEHCELSEYISLNPDPWALEYMRTHQHVIDWAWLSMNPSIFVAAKEKLVNILADI